MDACHLLLGRPWQYNRVAKHDGKKNTYSFMFDNMNIVLLPSKEVEPKPTKGDSENLFVRKEFVDEMFACKVVLVLMGKESIREKWY